MTISSEFKSLTGTKVEKPWGFEEILEHNVHYTVKRLNIKAGERMSLQYHREKTETVYVLRGVLSNWTSDDDNNYDIYSEGSTLHIEPGDIHRFGAFGQDCVILECSRSMLDDVVRLRDDYGR